MRAPDFVIGDRGEPYLLRWYVIPRNNWFNIYLHKFLHSDDDRALHDHPYVNLSILLCGCYIEHVRGRHGERKVKLRKPWRPWAPWRLVARLPSTAHRVELLAPWVQTIAGVDRQDQSVWTLFLTGPRVREWGFWCPQGWRHWSQFAQRTPDGSSTSTGCE